jgi:hypothetical protein
MFVYHFCFDLRYFRVIAGDFSAIRSLLPRGDRHDFQLLVGEPGARRPRPSRPCASGGASPSSARALAAASAATYCS